MDDAWCETWVSHVPYAVPCQGISQSPEASIHIASLILHWVGLQTIGLTFSPSTCFFSISYICSNTSLSSSKDFCPRPLFSSISILLMASSFSLIDMLRLLWVHVTCISRHMAASSCLRDERLLRVVAVPTLYSTWSSTTTLWGSGMLAKASWMPNN